VYGGGSHSDTWVAVVLVVVSGVSALLEAMTGHLGDSRETRSGSAISPRVEGDRVTG
jgi:hypothetical protein